MQCVIFNSYTGEVTLSSHALQQFINRYAKAFHREATELQQADLFVVLSQSFREATKVDLPKKKTLRRLLNNGGDPAVYLYNWKLNLRFVVSELHPRILMTVEVPKTSVNSVNVGKSAESSMPSWYQRYSINKAQEQPCGCFFILFALK